MINCKYKKFSDWVVKCVLSVVGSTISWKSPFLNLTIKACSYISQNDSRQLAVVLIQFLGSICLWLCLLIFHMLIYCIKHNMTWENVMNPLPSVVLRAKWESWQGGARGEQVEVVQVQERVTRITNVHTGLFCYQQYVCAFYFWMEGWPRTVHLLITSLPHRHLLYKSTLCCRVKCQILWQLSKSWFVRLRTEQNQRSEIMYCWKKKTKRENVRGKNEKKKGFTKMFWGLSPGGTAHESQIFPNVTVLLVCPDRPPDVYVCWLVGAMCSPVYCLSPPILLPIIVSVAPPVCPSLPPFVSLFSLLVSVVLCWSVVFRRVCVMLTVQQFSACLPACF